MDSKVCTMREKPPLTAVVVNYRTGSDLLEFLNSVDVLPLEDQLVLKEVLVIDVDPLEEFVLPPTTYSVRYFSKEDNVGYSGACNWASTLVDTELVAFFNADVLVQPGSLAGCCETLLGDPDRAVLGPLQLDQRGRVVHGGIFGSDDQPRHRAWHSRNLDGLVEVRDDAYSVSGSAYFVRMAVWRELEDCDNYACALNTQGLPAPVGAFLPTPHYYEETFCSLHARAHGYKVTYDGTKRMTHKWHQASAVGGHSEKVLLPVSREIFRTTCNLMGLVHD